MTRTYHGLTYPRLVQFAWQFWLWRKLFCKRKMHLFDEVFSSGGDDWNHYLVCDACGLMVEIKQISEQYKVG